MSIDLLWFTQLVSGQPELNIQSSNCWAHGLSATFSWLPVLPIFFLCLSQHFFLSIHFSFDPHFLLPQPHSSHVLLEMATSGPLSITPCWTKEPHMSQKSLFSSSCTWPYILLFFRSILSRISLDDVGRR